MVKLGNNGNFHDASVSLVSFSTDFEATYNSQTKNINCGGGMKATLVSGSGSVNIPIPFTEKQLTLSGTADIGFGFSLANPHKNKESGLTSVVGTSWGVTITSRPK